MSEIGNVEEPMTETNEQPEAAVASEGAPRAMPKWEEAARERVRTAIKKQQKLLAELLGRDANEGETRLLVTDFLCDGLGYDKFADLTMEYAVQRDFADYAIRIDKELVAFVEVKRVGTKLGIKHLRQVQMYAVNEGVEWAILTNGAQWQVYHLTGGLPVITELAFEVDLLGPESPAQKAKLLFYLCRESFKKHLVDQLWQQRRATCPESLGKALRTKPVLEALRKQIWRETGYKVDPTELVKLLEDTVLRRECLRG